MQAQSSKLIAGTGGGLAAWSGVLALSLGAFALVASEFMPVSLLTPIADDLRVTEGQAGQAISISGAFAVLTSVFITSIAGKLDRKTLLLILTAAMIVSGALVAFSPNYMSFMIGRALVGVAIGGFWSMSAATAMRLVPLQKVPKALAIVNGGNALATVIAAPLGSFLGSIVGWRGAFFAVVPVAAIVLVWQWGSLPSMEARSDSKSGGIFALMTRPAVAIGMLAVSLFFMGQFALFTYLRPFLETVPRLEVSTLSLVLLMMGVTGFIGTTLVGAAIQRSMYGTLIVIPLLMAMMATLLIVFGESLAVTTTVLGFWGLFATSAPVAWWTWLSKTMPSDAEAGGGLLVAVVQLAITSGAVLGGMLFDSSGYQATFALSAFILFAAGILAAFTARFASSE